MFLSDLFRFGNMVLTLIKKNYRNFFQINLVLFVKTFGTFPEAAENGKTFGTFLSIFKKKYILSLYVKTKGIRIKGREMALI